ncbi:hypothetical protein CAOG_04182 [Capsaspora owczarzaki ATCC 30864]|uniref:PRELI/MSF1 domain-containing protein n=1 Tax=Capsaspora owczarzaki (strain ATCC 30864) TaxID=595528 RepID=A0A0D2X2Y9_CAPO3|nr:hypothetical protein CAOG_04182 [Capsaspora owczarzaki ATCC 30864]KJE93389.1 hypothetical protein CAOG_004182 [Capsaspora owczarzaki ATCC 30864]|eukprot:XP_004348007.1 hypothetical protein CAOG_04182 [Capsaspora owczarzaki ATCC 30864]
MVRIWKSESKFDASFDETTTAFWVKYSTGHPLTKHVMCSDVVDRHIDPDTGVLHTTRILVKTNPKPKWGEMISAVTTAYIVERTTVDPVTRTMTTFTRNVNHKRLMTIEERCVYTQDPSCPNTTHCKTEATVTSNVWGWAGTLEKFGVDRFKSNAVKAQNALSTVIQIVRDEKQLFKQAAADKRASFKAAASALFEYRPQPNSSS